MSALQAFTKDDNLEYLAENLLEQTDDFIRNVLDNEQDVMYNGEQEFFNLLQTLIEFYRKHKERN